MTARFTAPGNMTAVRPEPQLAVAQGDLHVAAGPAQPLLPQAPDGVGLLGPADGVRLEHPPAPAQLRLEGGEGALDHGRGLAPAAPAAHVAPPGPPRPAAQPGAPPPPLRP